MDGPAGDLARALGGAGGLVLAVSGGPDSTALMVLVAGWAERPPTLVVSVDHGLRPEAGAETRQVAANATRLGLNSRIVRCPDLEPGGNLQARARDARYACLRQAAEEAGFHTIATAHHQNDQAETFLLRLARGSGVHGLGAIRETRNFGGLRLVRPLLGRSRAELAAIAAASGLPVAHDPSNGDTRYDRVRLRGIMPLLAEHRLDAVRLAGTARRMARAADALDSLAAELIGRHFTADRFGSVRGDPRGLAEAHREIALRALSRMIAAVAGAPYGPDEDGVEPLLDAVVGASPGERWQRTLHGAVIACAAGRMTLRREWGRNGLAAVSVNEGETVLWDGRFRVEVPPAGSDLSVGPLARAAELRLAGRGAEVRTLPGLYAAGRLVAAPEGLASPGRGPVRPAVLDVACLVPARLGLAVAA